MAIQKAKEVKIQEVPETQSNPNGIPLEQVRLHQAALVAGGPGSANRLEAGKHGMKLWWMNDHVLITGLAKDQIIPHAAVSVAIKSK